MDSFVVDLVLFMTGSAAGSAATVASFRRVRVHGVLICSGSYMEDEVGSELVS